MPTTSKPMIRIHDTELDEVVDRQMTNAEFAAYEADMQATLQLQAEAAAKAAAKQAVLDKLGLSTEEVAALLG
jgi:hypothetical protein